MGKARVTVVIPTYNKGKYIGEAIESVRKQTLKRWKMIIVDDASTDDTKSIVEPIVQKDTRIEYVRLEQNLGISGVMKRIVPMIQTKYFIQLDGDDWLEEDALELLLNGMEAFGKKVAVAYGNLVRWKENEIVDGQIVKKNIQHRQIKDKYDFITYHNMIYPRFYRTKYTRKVGGWRTDLPHGGRYSEDRQMLLKLISKYSFLHIDKHLYNHRIHSSNNSGVSNLEKYAEVNRYLYEKALKDWGDEYEPIYVWKSGRLKVKKLKKKKKAKDNEDG